jgi:hypothetical protein
MAYLIGNYMHGSNLQSAFMEIPLANSYLEHALVKMCERICRVIDNHDPEELSNKSQRKKLLALKLKALDDKSRKQQAEYMAVNQDVQQYIDDLNREREEPLSVDEVYRIIENARRWKISQDLWREKEQEYEKYGWLKGYLPEWFMYNTTRGSVRGPPLDNLRPIAAAQEKDRQKMGAAETDRRERAGSVPISETQSSQAAAGGGGVSEQIGPAEIEPTDKEMQRYVEWLRDGGGQPPQIPPPKPQPPPSKFL